MNIIASRLGSLLAASLLFMSSVMAEVIPMPGVNVPNAAIDSDITIKVKYYGKIPNDGVPTAGAPNMQAPVSHYWRMYGVDNQGILYRWSFLLNKALILYDRDDALNDGIDLVDEQEFVDDIGPTKPILNILGDHNPFKVYVMFSTKTAPDDVPVHYLPEGRFENIAIDFDGVSPIDCENDPFAICFGELDIYDFQASVPPFAIPGFASISFETHFQTLYEFTIVGNKLYHPRPIVAMEAQALTRHDGGGMALAPDGRIIFARGDFTPAGFGGRAAPQQLQNLPDTAMNTVGKILLIDPHDGDVEIAAIGTRNVEQMQVVGKYPNQRVIWGNIGRIIAEEVNSLSMSELLTPPIENLGWGCDAGNDGLWASDGNCENLPILPNVIPTVVDATEVSREGTFKIDQGLLGGGPFTLPGLQDPGDTTIKPLAQYSRFTEEGSFAISGPVVSDKSFHTITALFTDLASGKVFAIKDNLDGTDVTVYRVNLINEDGTPLANNSFNDLTGGRVDPRLFTFPSGKAGVLLESTGDMYRLREVSN